VLDSVYTADASGLGTDRTRLLRLAAAGQHVVGLRDAVGAVQLVSSSADAAALRVTGALAAYTLVDRHDHVVRAVPAAPARTFVMVLRRVDLDWRVQSVHG
jgi:hypothetical protein